LESVGWLSTLLLGLCGLPMAWQAIKLGHAHGVSRSFLWMWYIGEWAGVAYSAWLGAWPIIINCLINCMFISIIIKYSYFPRRRI